jgi:hypothetical protein
VKETLPVFIVAGNGEIIAGAGWGWLIRERAKRTAQCAMLTNLQRLNMYAYGGNHPYNYVDPDGNFLGNLYRYPGQPFFVPHCLSPPLMLLTDTLLSEHLISGRDVKRKYIVALISGTILLLTEKTFQGSGVRGIIGYGRTTA